MPIEVARAVVLSLQPQWEEAVLEGRKTFEYRRRWPKVETPYPILVYCSSPVSALVGVGIVRKTLVDSPAQLAAAEAALHGPALVAEVLAYLNGCESAAALEISNYQRLARPIALPQLRTLGFVPPQNYAFLATYPKLASYVAQDYERQSDDRYTQYRLPL